MFVNTLTERLHITAIIILIINVILIFSNFNRFSDTSICLSSYSCMFLWKNMCFSNSHVPIISVLPTSWLKTISYLIEIPIVTYLIANNWFIAKPSCYICFTQVILNKRKCLQLLLNFTGLQNVSSNQLGTIVVKTGNIF